MGKKKNGEAAAEQGNTKAAQKEAVRRAVEALGGSADIEALSSWIKENTSTPVENKLIGLYKYHMGPKKAKAGGKKRGRPRKHPEAAVTNGPSAKASPPSKKMVAVEDMRVVKGLLSRYGAGPIREVVELLAK
jgi:hypothetical protein